jgi:hypothetical protein
MHSRVAVCLLALTSGTAGLVSAQTSAIDQARFAAEITGSNRIPIYTPIVNGMSTLLYDSSQSRKAPGDANARVASALKIEYHVEGEVVQITATAFYGDFDRLKTPVSLYNLPQEKVDTVSARLNQTVTLSGMAAAGLEPLTLKIVAAQSDFPIHPQVLSKAPSLSIELTGEDRTFYRVALRNLSSKAVTAIGLAMQEENDRHASTTDAYPKDLIAPGATYQTQIAVPRGGKWTDGKFVEAKPMLTLCLEAALFRDGSFDGDVQAAAELAAGSIARDMQRQRMNQAIEPILADGSSTEDAKLARMRSAVGELSEEPDAGILARLRSQFPGLPVQLPPSLVIALKNGMRSQKHLFDFEMQEFARRKATIPGYTLARWWTDRQRM